MSQSYKSLLKVNQLVELEVNIHQKELDNTESFSSRIEDLPGDNILVAAPFRQGTPVSFPLGKEIRIRVRKDGVTHLLHTKLIERKKSPQYLFLLSNPFKISRLQMRNWVRVDADLPVNYRMAGYPIDFYQATTVDISGGGIGLRSEHEIDKDTLLELQVQLPKAYLLQSTGLVTRCLPEKRGYYVIGIEFKDISTNDQDCLVRYVFQKQREHIKKRVLK